MFTRTKIICTIGPSCNTYDKILQLIDAGMNGARLNFSHGTHEEHRAVIALLKRARIEKKVPLAIILDTKGPEIRVGKVIEGGISLKEGQKILLTPHVVVGDAAQIPITPGRILDDLGPGVKVLFDDGYIGATVVEKTSSGVMIAIDHGGILKSHKGVNILDVDIQLPAMTPQDIEDITFGCKEDVDIIAASFIRSADHILEIKELLARQGKPDILVMAKIENSLGVRQFDQIVEVADGIMVARGDLGVELPLKQVPQLQKMMIRRSYRAAKPVVTATQMLESMIYNPRPTRAEVSDVANAIYDSTSAVMLSGETAAGKYPIEAVKMMKSIAQETERDFGYKEFFSKRSNFEETQGGGNVSTAVSLATVETAYNVKAEGIFVFTSQGFTARLVSRFRPEMPILALTSHPKVYHQLSIHWGVIPVDPVATSDVEDALQKINAFALKEHIVKLGDLVVVTAGTPFGVSGTTNMMWITKVSNGIS